MGSRGVKHRGRIGEEGVAIIRGISNERSVAPTSRKTDLHVRTPAQAKGKTKSAPT